MAGFIYSTTAFILATVAWLLWWRAIPPMRAERGLTGAVVPWLLGMAMTVIATQRLEQAGTGANLSWLHLFSDVCLIALALIVIIRATRLGAFKWNRCPVEVRASR